MTATPRARAGQWRRRAAFAVAAALMAGVWLAAASANATVPSANATVPSCTRYASPAGQDGWPGTELQPLRTAQKLVSSLRPGEAGCLIGGTFVEDLTIRAGGFPGMPVTLASAPGTRATLVGRMWIADSANWVTVADLDLDGRNAANLPSPTVNGDEVVFTGNDVTNQHTSICFALGSHAYGIASGVVIERNRIHDCGRLPATNHHHGIYVEAARGTVIRDNWIFGNADRGIQLYPDAQGTLIANNVIAGNGTGIIFSGDTSEDAGSGGSGYYASSNNVVRENIITGSVRYNLDSWWTGAPGTGNVVSDNCIWGAGRADIGGDGGFTVTSSVDADPLYARSAAGDYSLARGSPCSGYGPRVSPPSTSAPSVPPSTPAAAPAPAAAAPVNVAAPAIVLSRRRAAATTGDWKAGAEAPTFTFRWLRCDPTGAGCVPLPGATARMYETRRWDVGRTLRVEVTAHAGAVAASATSAAALVRR